jgi:hypothetical protein
MRVGRVARAVTAAAVATGGFLMVSIPPATAATHASDVTGSITLDGTPVQVNLATAGQNGRYSFSGTTGQRVSVVVSQSTVGPACPALLVSLVRPDATTLGTPASTCKPSAFLDAQTLDQNGTWTILLDPQGSNTGHLTLQAYAVTDQNGTIVRNGVAVPVTIDTPGQNARFTFSSVAGQQVSAYLSASTFGAPCGTVVISLLRPDGSAFGAHASSCKQTAFLDSQTLDADGNWSIVVDPQGAQTGAANLQAWNTNDTTGLVHLDGTVAKVTTANPGQNAAMHFVGDVGQKVAVRITGSTYTGCPAFLLSLIRPDGTGFGSTVSTCNANAFLDAQALDQQGVWIIEIDPQKMTTGTANLQAWDATDDVHAITLNGAPVNVDLVPGQDGNYTFTGATGQLVSAQISSSTIAGCPAFALSLERPNGTTLGTPVTTCNAKAFLDTLKLDANGTWSIVVDPIGPNAGTATLDGFTFTDDTGVAELTGKPAYLNFNRPGQNARWTFSGSSGQHVSAYLTQSTLAPCNVTVSLVRPDGTTLASIAACAATAFLEPQVLDQSGTWTAVVDPQGVGTGTATLQLYNVVDTVLPFKPGSNLKTFTSESPGKNAIYHFTGKVGDSRTVTISGSTYPCPGIVVSFLRPDGSVLKTDSTCTKDLTLTASSLDAAGTWTLFIDPQGPATGTMIIRLT